MEYRESFPLPLSEQDERACLAKMQQGDKQAKDQLILHNMRLVVHIARKYHVQNDNEDLISIGYFGLVKGLEHFKQEKVGKLSTYLGKCIENEILMELRAMQTQNNHICLEDQKSKQQTQKLARAIADNQLKSQISNFLDKEQVSNYLSCLTELERLVIVLRYGLIDNLPRSQREVGPMLNFSHTYIGHIEKTALQKMQQKAILDESVEILNNLF